MTTVTLRHMRRGLMITMLLVGIRHDWIFVQVFANLESIAWFVSFQINLSEYRNRARKPAERKITSEKSSPPQTTSSSSLSLLSTPSFLSQSIASRILLSSPSLSSYQPSSLKLSSSAGTLGGVSSLSGQVGVSSGIAPQFEPVSPDDVDDGTPTNSGGTMMKNVKSEKLLIYNYTICVVFCS